MRREVPRPQPTPQNETLVATAEAPVIFAEPISNEIDAAEAAAGSAKCFEGAMLNHRKQVGRAAVVEERRITEKDPLLSSSEDIGSDLSVKTTLNLSTSHLSFRWLRRLPPALFCQALRVDSNKGSAARDAVLEVCRECLPALTEAPEKAVRWMERIASCLCWHQLDGPVRPPHPALASRNQTVGAEDRVARRRVEEWDEGYRSLEVLLRQGMVSTYTMLADRFSVSVYGDGAGPWVQTIAGTPKQPSRSTPCAVMCPSPGNSLDSIRTMLQESHVPFEVAVLCKVSTEGPPSNGATAPATVAAAATSEGVLVATSGGVPGKNSSANGAAEHDQLKSDLRELRSVGERVVCPEEVNGTLPICEALWFEGAWRVHALLDVMRQHFLAAPLPGAPRPPNKLPRLLSPTQFGNSTARSAEVIGTQTLSRQVGGSVYTAELEGFFFPRQVRMLLEMFRVLLPSFSCGMTADVRHRAGINAFTQLGMKHVEFVECERTQAGRDAAAGWRWEFKLGT